ncbi:MAG: alpha/beta hydrolase [Desulfurococcales archaeon]|nr:alpha/beta hydrolase [Desulfurococcales archaeon]
METGTYTIKGIECGIAYNREGWGPVVLLHGYSFTWKVWHEIGLLGELEAKGYSYIAPDMPYGRYSSCDRKIRDPDTSVSIVKSLVGELGGRPVLLGASLGGYIALKYAARHGAGGLILVAPVGLGDPELESLQASPPPTLIVYGSKDSIVNLDDMRRLESSLKGSKLVVYEGAGHAAYLDAPGKFLGDVLDFLERLRS